MGLGSLPMARRNTTAHLTFHPPSGKINGINDFCLYVGNTEANWIGKMVNLNGVTVDGGCARCHAGLGARPDPNSADTLQLENIDCLICHSPKYRRTVKEITPGTFRFVPDEAAMGVTIMEAAADIHLTSRGLCLQCHARSGGGNNFKRGDLEMAHQPPDPGLRRAHGYGWTEFRLRRLPLRRPTPVRRPRRGSTACGLPGRSGSLRELPHSRSARRDR